ncbi:hypothetical protein WDZ92_44915, partial [Nostoc sp. NIES-2111]
MTNGSATIDVTSIEEQQEVVSENIEEHVAAIRASVKKSRSLSGRIEEFKPDGLDVSIAATVWAIPPQSSVLKLLAGVAAPLLKRAVMSAISPTGARGSVVAMIDRA